jgi:hypothetical protein
MLPVQLSKFNRQSSIMLTLGSLAVDLRGICQQTGGYSSVIQARECCWHNEHSVGT